jgi:hypothetical protein
VESKVQPKLTLAQEVEQMATRDEYRDDESGAGKGKDHRLSRKKRRRNQALAEMEEEGKSTSTACALLVCYALHYRI